MKGIVYDGPAVFRGSIMDSMGNIMYDVEWYKNNKPSYASIIYYDVFPWADFVKVNEPVPPHIRLKIMIQKKSMDQLVREMFDRYELDSEPGSLADYLRACLGASAPKGSGRLSSTDVGKIWVKQTVASR